MLCNRIKQFREYNNVDVELLSSLLGISKEEYESYETGVKTPTISIIEDLAKCYKVTVDEFYGYTPRLSLHTSDVDLSEDVPTDVLKMSDLSWDEKQLILHYRSLDEKDEIIKAIIEKTNLE